MGWCMHAAPVVATRWHMKGAARYQGKLYAVFRVCMLTGVRSLTMLEYRPDSAAAGRSVVACAPDARLVRRRLGTDGPTRVPDARQQVKR
jgi:hypothetical protein